jgi:uncharacterized protein YjaG (DUF416 family)
VERQTGALVEFKPDEQLTRSLKALSGLKQVAFLLLLCERMMPEFRKFAKDTGFDLTVYGDCLEEGWEYLGGKAREQNYENLAKACLESAPDTENFDDQLTSAALDTALSISYLMSFLADHAVDHIVDSVGLALDTVALFVQRTEAVAPYSLSLDRVDGHWLMQRELKRQEEDLVLLERLPSDVASVIPILRKRAKEPPEMLAGSTEVKG